MKPQEKYEKCVVLLSEMHDLIFVMIEDGLEGDMKPLQIIEETVAIVKSLEEKRKGKVEVRKEADVKDKKFFH